MKKCDGLVNCGSFDTKFSQTVMVFYFLVFTFDSLIYAGHHFFAYFDVFKCGILYSLLILNMINKDSLSEDDMNNRTNAKAIQ